MVLDIRDLVACMESVELLVALESRERRYAPPTITCITCKAFDPLPGLFKIMLFPLSSSQRVRVDTKDLMVIPAEMVPV